MKLHHCRRWVTGFESERHQALNSSFYAPGGSVREAAIPGAKRLNEGASAALSTAINLTLQSLVASTSAAEKIATKSNPASTVTDLHPPVVTVPGGIVSQL